MDKKLTKFTIGELNEIENSDSTYFRYCKDCCRRMNIPIESQGSRLKIADWNKIIENPECFLCGSDEYITDKADEEVKDND